MIDVSITNNYCVVEPKGPLTAEDFAEISSRVDPVIEREGELDGLIIKTREFPGWESFGDIVEHFKFVRNHHQKIEKIALVTDAKVAEVFPRIASHFVKAQVRQFDYDDFDEAVEWVS